jgi:hypothetical protein
MSYFSTVNDGCVALKLSNCVTEARETVHGSRIPVDVFGREVLRKSVRQTERILRKLGVPIYRAGRDKWVEPAEFRERQDAAARKRLTVREPA